MAPAPVPADRSASQAGKAPDKAPDAEARGGQVVTGLDTAPVAPVEPAVTSELQPSTRVVEAAAAVIVPSFLGLIAYAILREAYVWFYQRYTVAPEEVGIDQVRMLTSVLRFVHLWVWSLPGSPVINILVALLGGGVLVSLWRRVLPRLRRRSTRIDMMASRHPVLLGFSAAVLLVIMSFAWALPLDRSFAGKRLQLGRAVHPAELAYLSIEADPVRVTWIGDHPPPAELLTAKLVYLGKADGIVVLYQPPDWHSCPTDSCRGATWKVKEDDVVLRIEVNPPDQDAPKPHE